MRERPILFSSAMVRAILEGRKTQTRRIVRGKQPTWPHYLQAMYGRSPPPDPVDFGERGLWREVGPDYPDDEHDNIRCPYGADGDRLWVRETWGAADQFYQGHDLDEPRTVAYAADKSAMCFGDPRQPKPVPSWDIAQWNWERVKWKPSIHMSRWMARLLLEVTGVRVERLQDISPDDARAEGMPPEGPQPAKINGELGSVYYFDPVVAFAHGWNTINGKRAPWTSNPWVWVVSFRRLEA